MARQTPELHTTALWVDAICMYFDRSSIKHLRNLRCLSTYLEKLAFLRSVAHLKHAKLVAGHLSVVDLRPKKRLAFLRSVVQLRHDERLVF
jgi:hypothetical protein